MEQVIYLHRKGADIPAYRSLRRDGRRFRWVGRIGKDEHRRFGLYLNCIDEAELQIAHRMLAAGEFLGDYCAAKRGASIQKELSDLRRGHPCIGGRNVQQYHLRGIRGYYDSQDVPDSARIAAGQLLVQRIVAHVDNPLPHIKFIAHAVRADETHLLIANTIIRITVDGSLPPYFVLGLLHSRLMRWYVYRFIYAKAIRSADFDGSVVERIPLPDFARQPTLVAEIVAAVERIYANRHANQAAAQAEIDRAVFRLYGLSEGQTALVERNMP